MYIVQRTHIAYKLSDLRYLNSIMPIGTDQLARISSAMTDVMTYNVRHGFRRINRTTTHVQQEYSLPPAV